MGTRTTKNSLGLRNIQNTDGPQNKAAAKRLAASRQDPKVIDNFC